MKGGSKPPTPRSLRSWLRLLFSWLFSFSRSSIAKYSGLRNLLRTAKLPSLAWCVGQDLTRRPFFCASLRTIHLFATFLTARSNNVLKAAVPFKPNIIMDYSCQYLPFLLIGRKYSPQENPAMRSKRNFRGIFIVGSEVVDGYRQC